MSLRNPVPDLPGPAFAETFSARRISQTQAREEVGPFLRAIACNRIHRAMAENWADTDTNVVFHCPSCDQLVETDGVTLGGSTF